MRKKIPSQNQIRLSHETLSAIENCFERHFLKGDTLWLFGSRVDPTQKGGDIDLYIETLMADPNDILTKKIDFLVDLKMQIGEQKIDVVMNYPGASPLAIFEQAKNHGIQLR